MATANPFLLGDEAAYRQWRVDKLRDYPRSSAELIVDVADPFQLTAAEHEQLASLLRRCNMAIYRTRLGSNPDKAIPRALAERFGLRRLDSNLLADEDGLSSITVSSEGDRPTYIPYTNRPINWHCDGYYNTGAQQIRGMLLHCVQDAADGGDNRLLDPEIIYLQLRDIDPAHIVALMAEDAMSIPPGRDGEGEERAASVGPVFSLDAEGHLHMRYTARKRNIAWKDDALTRAALAALEGLLEDDNPYRFRAHLEPGMGLICNNVLHTRDGFTDLPDAPKRLLYRARYFDRTVV
ncbi:MAG: TauD/TfdA family dioxygenase [Thiohalomonadaceae bacterium]